MSHTQPSPSPPDSDMSHAQGLVELIDCLRSAPMLRSEQDTISAIKQMIAALRFVIDNLTPPDMDANAIKDVTIAIQTVIIALQNALIATYVV